MRKTGSSELITTRRSSAVALSTLLSGFPSYRELAISVAGSAVPTLGGRSTAMDQPNPFSDRGNSETSSAAYVPAQFGFFEGVGKEQSWASVLPESRSLDERLFDALASAKIATANFAMHLPRSWRDRFFERLDAMHDPAEWEEDDSILDAKSIRTFLRAWMSWKPTTNPGFGISSKGNLLSAWSNGDSRLTLEYLPNDLVTWLIMIPHRDEDWVERASAVTKLDRFHEKVAPYSASEWMYAENRKGSPSTR